MRTLAVALMLPLVAFAVTGCATTGGHGSFDQNWPKVEPVVQNAVSMAAQYAFVQPQIAPYKAQICQAANVVSDYLDNNGQLVGVLDGLKPLLMAQVQAFIAQQKLPPQTAAVVQITVDGVLTAGIQCAERNFADVLKQDQSKAAFAVARALSDGLKQACAQ